MSEHRGGLAASAETDIAAIVRSVCADSGHWPYTADSDLFIGYRPGPESVYMAGTRLIRVMVRYDLVIVATRCDLAVQMETMRYRLYDALLAGGWKFDGEPGPETYDARARRFMWPVSVVKGFATL